MNLRERAYRHIHERLRSGRLPPGSVVSDRSLAAEIGISKTPVREAIRQLEHEGLLEAVARHGTRVRAPDPREQAGGAGAPPARGGEGGGAGHAGEAAGGAGSH